MTKVQRAVRAYILLDNVAVLLIINPRALLRIFFFFNHPPPTEIYPLPLPDALPILTASLRRLDTDCVDVYQLHINELPVAEASDLVGACEDLVAEGLIRTYGWSTDDPERVDVFADRKSTSELQSQSNLVCRLLLANK